jgi:hypothetical protein
MTNDEGIPNDEVQAVSRCLDFAALLNSSSFQHSTFVIFHAGRRGKSCLDFVRRDN